MIRAESFIKEAKGLGFRLFTGVPCSYLKPFINYVIDAPGLDYIGAANEGDAVAIASGAELAGARSMVMFQNSGFGNAVSPLSSLNSIFRIPVLTLLMGLSMLVQQRMTPQAGDPTQQRMMMIMPIMFVALFLRSPSGLAIYYLTSNLLTIGQQYITNRLIGGTVPAAPRPAAERRLKTVGSGRTEGAERKS